MLADDLSFLHTPVSLPPVQPTAITLWVPMLTPERIEEIFRARRPPLRRRLCMRLTARTVKTGRRIPTRATTQPIAKRTRRSLG